MTMPKCIRLAMIKQRRFVAAVLGRARGKGAANLSVQGAAHPQCTRPFQEAAHCRRHATETSGRADCDRVIVGQFLRRRDRRGLVELEMGGLRNRLSAVLRHPFDIDRSPGRTVRSRGRVSPFD
jgi:hypothetical protein